MSSGFGRCVLATALSALVLTTGAATAATKSSAPLRCDKLPGKVILKTAKVKVTQAKQGKAEIVRACTLPRGKVYKVATVVDGDTLTPDKNAGTWFSYSASTSEAFSTSTTVALFNAATGKGYQVWYGTVDGKDPQDKQALDAYFFDKDGHATTAQGRSYGPENSDEWICAFAPDGTSIVLDHGTQAEIPGTSLAFANGVITWTHTGETRTAEFSRPF